MINHDIKIHPVSSVDIQQFVKALNLAYADYHVPIQLTRHTFLDLADRESVDLDASCIAVIDGQIVGMGLLGIRQQHGWIGGMGVIPRFRRHGIGRSIMQTLLTHAWNRGMHTVQLEVITENTPACTLYQSLGFCTRQQLLVLNCTRARYQLLVDRSAVAVVEESPVELIEHLPEFAFPAPSWQTEIDALKITLPTLYGLAARRRSDHQLVGMCLYQYNGHQGSVAQLCAADKKYGSMLLTHLFQQHRVTNFSYLNVPESDPMLPSLKKTGFKVSVRQYEMILSNPQETRPS